jgi:myb proto-oncogene protein
VVAKYIPGRTGQQCAQRWRHRVNPDIKKEKWSAEEDRLLMRLVHQHGSAWAEIARGMQARTSPSPMP